MAKKENPVHVRSIYDLGDFNDDEVNNEPSMTDPSQDEPIEALVARMLRGECVSTGIPQFDTQDSSLSAEEIFARQSAMSKDGFDLADAATIQKRAEVALASIQPEVKAPPAEPEKPSSAASEAAPLPDK